METILDDYKINEHTLCVLPAAHMEYDAIVLEHDRQLFVRRTPFQLIQASCLDNGSTYNERRAAVLHRTGFKHKVPIPINPPKHIYAFPTHSPTNFACSWIFYQNILQMEQYHSIKDPTLKSIITFKNGQTLPMTVSHYILATQMQRTVGCMSNIGTYNGV